MSTENIQIYSFTLNESFNFKAYITSFNDSYSSTWKTENVFGKMDAIATFQNTARKVTMDIDVPSSDFLEAKNNFDNISKLISGLYPVYNDTARQGLATISSPPLFRIKYANLLVNTTSPSQGLLCYFDSGFTFTPDFTVGVFNSKDEIYPKLFKASLAFTVLHEHPLGRNTAHQSRTGKSFPYISNSDINTLLNQSSDNFKTQNKTLGDYLKELEKQKQSNRARAQRGASPTPQITPENAIQQALKQNLGGNATGQNPVDISRYDYNPDSNSFALTVGKETAGQLSKEELALSKKAQDYLYNKVKSKQPVKIFVVTGNNQNKEINLNNSGT